MAHATAPVIGDGSDEESQTFHEFFESWLVEQKNHLEELVSAAAAGGNTGGGAEEPILQQKIERVMEHYEHYYRAKSRWVKSNAFSMFTPSWRSSLEDAFMWTGGWRPSMAFHLLYSKSGIQLEARLHEIIQGVVAAGDLGDLSQSQLNRVDELQKETIGEEKGISEKLAKQQETVADSSMVELSHAATEAMREGSEDAPVDGDRIEAALASKEEELVRVLLEADHLRLKTLKRVVGILNPMQVVHFLIAAAELHLRFHEWGKKMDAHGGGDGRDHQQ